SAIVSLSFLCSCTARILTARIRSSGRSSVVFIATQIPGNLVFCQCERVQRLRRFSSAKKLIDSRPRSSTLAGLPVDVSRLPPVPLSIFTLCVQRLRREIHFLVERLEARIRTKRIVHRLHLEPAYPPRPLLVGLLEPIDGLVALTQPEIDQGLTKRSNEALAGELIQFLQCFQRFVSLPVHGVGISKVSSDNRLRFHRLSQAKFLNALRIHFWHAHSNGSQNEMGKIETRIEFQCFVAFR